MSEDALEQILVNLLVNAGHAVENTDQRLITVEGAEDERSVHISITDTGCGIDENVQSRLFEPFFTTKKAGKGSGLGLSICHDIIRRFKGRLEFKSTKDIGTTFTITLPKGGRL